MEFQDLSKRLLCSSLILIVIALILLFAYLPYVNWIIAIFLSLVGGVGMWEYVGLTRSNRALLLFFGIMLVFSFFLSSHFLCLAKLPWITLFLGAVSLFLYYFNKISGAASSIALGFFGLCYVAIPIGLIFPILFPSPQMGGEGRYWLIYLLVVTKITDVGAYFGGKLLGKRKLAAELSPGKTITGALFGFFSAIIFSLLFYRMRFLFPFISFTLVESLWLGALLGCLGQIGDLAESLLKRDAGVKDSNRLPGLGGVLDMLDSLLFTIPVVYLFLYFKVY
jgi:phosphatidate cytidylyltransferase